MISTEQKVLSAALLAGLLISLTACKSAGDQKTLKITQMDDSQIPVTQLKAPAIKMNLKEKIEFSRNDLAQRLGVAPESVELSNARAVTWRSGALGCPKPGIAYTEVLVPGTLIFLRVGNTLHAYHSGRDGSPFYCPRERVEQPVLDRSLDVT